MSQIVVKNLGHHVQVTTDSSNMLLWDHEVEPNTYTNGTGSTVVLAKGTVLAVLNATGKVVVLDNTATTTGAQYVYGILANEYSIAAGATVTVGVAIRGNFDPSKLVFVNAETINTVISGRRYREWFQDRGLQPVSATEMTKNI